MVSLDGLLSRAGQRWSGCVGPARRSPLSVKLAPGLNLCRGCRAPPCTRRGLARTIDAWPDNAETSPSAVAERESPIRGRTLAQRTTWDSQRVRLRGPRGCRLHPAKRRRRDPASRAKERSGRRCPTYPWQSQSRSRRRPTALPVHAYRGHAGTATAPRRKGLRDRDYGGGDKAERRRRWTTVGPFDHRRGYHPCGW